LTDQDKDEVDAAATKTIRELRRAIKSLQEVEEVRQKTEQTLTQRKYKKLGGALVSWAAGGAGHNKTMDQELDEAKMGAISSQRENIILYLGEKLKDCAVLQRSMMEKRINRILEKRKGVLANAKPRSHDLSTFATSTTNHASISPDGMAPQYQPDEDLTPEQKQMFEEDHQDMLRHFEDRLTRVTLVNLCSLPVIVIC
jgi:syntaxin 18